MIVNAAAYTAVDQAESEAKAAFAVNAEGPRVLAEEARRLGALLVHYSTDYVFNGRKTAPYSEDDFPDPINIYGASKLAGERAIRESGCRQLILRTSWVYAARGNNFLTTILRLAREKNELRVVHDQWGAPTDARFIAETTTKILKSMPARSNLYHLSAAGKTTWFGFAGCIARKAGLPVRITPISTEDYPTPAARPANSILDCGRLECDFGVLRPPWESAAGQTVEEALYRPSS